MKQLKTIIRHAQFLSLGLCLAILSAGCSSVAVTRTIGLPGLTPLASAGQVKLVEEGKPVTQPYQLVGEVTVSDNQKPPSKGFSYKRMKEVAAAMGADGVIGVHLGMGAPPLRSGLAVKWLAPGEAKRPVTKPFVVAMLPMTEDSKVPVEQAATTSASVKHSPSPSSTTAKVDNQAGAWTAAINSAVIDPLEIKGYYVLPPESVTYKGGLEGARDLGDAELRSLGGDDAHFLLEVAVTSKAQANIIVGASAVVQVKTTLMDKTTRKDIFQGSGTGQIYLGWLLNMTMDKHKMATGLGASISLNKLGPINEKVETK
jgi:hypothetical protein